MLARVLPSIREATFSYPLAIFTQTVWMPQKGLREEGSEGALRGGGLFLEPRGRPTSLFTASPLAFASSSASSLSCLSL